MISLAPIYVLCIFWTAVTALPGQNITPSKLYLGKQYKGTPRERWGIFFGQTGTGFTTNVPAQSNADEKTTIVKLKTGSHRGIEMFDLQVTIKIQTGQRDKLFEWIQNDMASTLFSPTPQRAWPPNMPFDSSPHPMRGFFYGGPEPDPLDPSVPLKRRRTGGSSLDMVWVILEELGKRNLYADGTQGVPQKFQDIFNKNYVKVWRRCWGETELGKKSINEMIRAYPSSRYPEWAKQWTDPL
ncbi:hypothetical protein D9757_003885 [Collybiopsis confluens]|uniref:Uncharacterized protein n=1 Tax=Collybiopsis confluens TaxID=2823264 RepID=A0A8H5HVN7_9AGAR|nr:hypothetical protein D9757_003885 [Collybiopsis confluens]